MKRSYKLRASGNVAAVLRSSPSLGAAAKKLGVHRTTLYRWMEKGDVTRQRPKEGPTTQIEVPADSQSAEEWGASERAKREPVTATQRQLIDAGVMVLKMSRDAELAPHVRIAAVARFQAIARDLAMDEAAAVGQPVRSERPPRTGTDPRAVLMAVK